MSDPLVLGSRDGGASVFTLPLDAQTQKFGIIGRSGSGKTNTAVVMVEEFAAAGLPFVVIDPLGVWHGLRSGADGASEGLPVTILGGAHGDLPLERTAGALVADLVVAHPGAYLLDLSGFESKAADRQFATDFFERLYRAKAKDPSALHLVIDEADTFAPQRAPSGDERMLGSLEAIARRGRARGLGLTLITQRPAVLNKNLLSQIECLIALQVTAPQDRDALKSWAEGYGDRQQVQDFLGSLAGLKRGEAWLWSPSWLETFVRVDVRRRRTFDSSATPKAGETKVEPSVLAAVDLEALRTAMAATVAKVEADDPKKLRVRIRELETQISDFQKTENAAANCNHEADLSEYRRTIDILRERLETEERATEAALADVAELQETMNQAVNLLTAPIRRGTLETSAPDFTKSERQLVKAPTPAAVSSADKPTPPPSSTRTAAAARQSQAVASTTSQGKPAGAGTDPLEGLKSGARAILAELASRYPAKWTRNQLGALTGYSASGGTFGTYLSNLRQRGLIEEDGKLVWASESALDALGADVRPPATHDEMMARWRQALKSGAYNMLWALVDAGQTGLTRAELAEAVEMSATGGTFGTYLSNLRTNALIVESGGFIVASDVLFPEGVPG